MAYIIVADDDPLLGDLVRFKLESAGHRVLTVADGQSAIDSIGAEQPDVLVLDAMMPVVSGRQVLQRVRAQPATAALPIIMLSARKGQEDVVSALQLGANDYVTKPFMPDELLLRIQTLLIRGTTADVGA